MGLDYQSVRIAEGTWSIEEERVRSFLLVGRQLALLVDTGMRGGDLRGAVQELTGLPVRLVNTHADPDHISCNHQFGEALLHPAEYAWYHSQRGPVASTRPLWEGDVIDLGSRRLEVIHIPGHTPGSIALLDRERRVLIGGDSVQSGDIFMFGPHRDLMAFACSMEKLLGLADRFDTVYASHGRVEVSPCIIGGLMDGARRILRREIAGTPSEMHGTPIQAFDIGVARILYERDW